jgi:hypothetical protein
MAHIIRALDYMLKALMFSGNLRPGLGSESVVAILSYWIYSRASQLGLVIDPVSDRDDLNAWFAAASADI